MAETDTGNIREILGRLIGKKLIDISQHDQEDLKTLDSFIQLMFDDGCTLRFYILETELYKAPAPLVMSDPNESSEWVPTAEEIASGNWAVVVSANPEQQENHVVPTHGKHHSLDIDCWCGTETELADNGILIVKHKEVA